MRNLNLIKFKFQSEYRKKISYLLFFSILIAFSFQEKLNSDVNNTKFDLEKNTIKWEKFNIDKKDIKRIIWQKKRN